MVAGRPRDGPFVPNFGAGHPPPPTPRPPRRAPPADPVSLGRPPSQGEQGPQPPRPKRLETPKSLGRLGAGSSRETTSRQPSNRTLQIPQISMVFELRKASPRETAVRDV